MLKLYEKPYKIQSSAVNAAGKLTVAEALRLFQDMAGEHSVVTGTDYYNLLTKNNAFWIITRTRLHFNREPVMYEDTVAKTWPNPPGSIAASRNYTLTGADGEVAVSAMSEWMIIDAETRRVRRVNTTCYPTDEEHIPDTAIDEPYHRLFSAFEDSDLVFTHVIRCSDTDMTCHTNNTVYCRLMLDAFPTSFFKENTVTDFELRYAMESREGETVGIYRRSEGGKHCLAVKNSAGKILVTAEMDTIPA